VQCLFPVPLSVSCLVHCAVLLPVPLSVSCLFHCAAFLSLCLAPSLCTTALCCFLPLSIVSFTALCCFLSLRLSCLVRSYVSCPSLSGSDSTSLCTTGGFCTIGCRVRDSCGMYFAYFEPRLTLYCALLLFSVGCVLTALCCLLCAACIWVCTWLPCTIFYHLASVFCVFYTVLQSTFYYALASVLCVFYAAIRYESCHSTMSCALASFCVLCPMNCTLRAGCSFPCCALLLPCFLVFFVYHCELHSTFCYALAVVLLLVLFVY
jgi:hypothetical protein